MLSLLQLVQGGKMVENRIPNLLRRGCPQDLFRRDAHHNGWNTAKVQKAAILYVQQPNPRIQGLVAGEQLPGRLHGIHREILHSRV